MKMKSAVLASALVAVSAVFADIYQDGDIYTSWFTAEPDSQTQIDTTLDNPTIVNTTAATASNGYAVTAEVSVVIHAALPAVPAAVGNVSPKGSICAAYDGNTAKWYGLKYENSSYRWEALTAITTTPVDAHPYTLVTEFDDTTTGAPKVRYWVEDQCSGWYTSGHANALQKVGLAGTGSYTKVVGLLVNAWKGTGIDTSIPIAISKATLVAMGIDTGDSTLDGIKTTLTADQGNGIAAWANYALGISDNVTEKVAATKKPFAAPVQNNDSLMLTFKLGGVSARKEVADVKYAIETLDSPNDSFSGALTYKSASDTTDITLDSSKVQYYRVKVQIDQTQPQADN